MTSQPLAGRVPSRPSTYPQRAGSPAGALCRGRYPRPFPHRSLLALFLLLTIAACAPAPAVPVSTETAFGACEAGALAELRRRDPAAREVRLDPIGSARVERPAPPPARRGARDDVALIIAGRGSATAAPGGDGSAFRYACLVGNGGEVVFLDVQLEGGSEIVEECLTRSGKDAGDVRTCLRNLAAGAETALAEAEADAITRARRREGGGRGRAEVDDPAAASIGAWRVYRDSECARRHGGTGDQREVACLIELTRSRVRELRQS